MENVKQELKCPMCGCNHMYVDTYMVPMRADVRPVTMEDAEFSDQGRQYSIFTTMFVFVLLCATIAFIAWLIWS
jgi:hypothetical protein